MTARTPFTASATVRSGLGIFALGLVAVAVLSACGGGDAVRAPATTTTTSTTATFVVSSSLATPTAVMPGGTVRYMIQGFQGSDAVSKEGTAAVPTFDANKAVIALDNHSLAATNGTYAVQEFMGDATFAQGRWTKGQPTINGVVSSTPLTGTDSTALHYLITRDMAAFPANGSYVCGTNVRSTGLTYSGGTVPSDTMKVGAALPDATVTVSGAGAVVSLRSVQVFAGDAWEVGYENQTLTFAIPSAGPVYLDNYAAQQEGAAFVLGEGTAANEITLGMAFRRTLSGGARYKGMTSVICKP